jgi:hypothetical protein
MHLRFRWLITVAVIFGCIIARPTPAAQAIAVSPVLFDFDIAQGSSKQGTVTIINDTDQEDVFRLEVRNFIAMGEDGAQEYLEEQEPTGLASWVSVNRPSVTLAPGQSAEFPFVVTVPADGEPGGHYASIFFSRAPREANGTGVGIGGKVGVLVLVNVPGEVREEARIESLTLQGDAWRSHLPAVFDLRIRNLGSVHFRPRGSLIIRNIFGQEIVRVPANPKNSAVLPNSVRRVESVWANTLEEELETGFWAEVRNEWKNFAFGRYTATVDISYGAQKKSLISPQVVLWVIPWRLSLFALGGLFVLVLLLKGYNRLLVRSALKKESRRRKSK